MSSPFGSPFGGVTKHPTRAGLTIPRTNLLAYYRGGIDTIGVSVTDESGNGNDFTVVSGTTWADVVVNAPDDAAMKAADTTNIFYTAAGVAKNVKLSMLLHNADNRIFAGNKAVAIYSTRQTDAVAARVERYVGTGYWFGGTFGFGVGADATEIINISTAGSVDWMCNGTVVASGAYYVAGTTEGVYFGLPASAISTTLNLGGTYITGQLSQLSRLNVRGDVRLYYTNLIGTLADITAWRPSGSADFPNNILISGDVASIADWRPNDCAAYLTSISGDVGLLENWNITNRAYFHNTSISACSSPNMWPNCKDIRLDGCAINQTGINNLLISAANGEEVSGAIRVSGGTNAAPGWGTEESPSSTTDAVVLLLQRGWTVTVNGGVPAWVTALV
jgi:hypothetical protein